MNSANSAISAFISSNSNMNATVSELKKIVDALVASNLTKSKEQILQEYNVPKVYIKGGKPLRKHQTSTKDLSEKVLLMIIQIKLNLLIEPQTRLVM